MADGGCREQAKAADHPGRHRLDSQPSSRTGENSPYGMIGGIEETSASFEARSAPRSYPTEGDISYRPRNDSSILSRMPRSCWNIQWRVELRRRVLNLALLEALECGSLVPRWKQTIGGTATWTHRGGTCFSRPCWQHCLRW